VLAAAAWLAAGARADTAPASLIACQTQRDAQARLACYDREMGRLHPVSAAAPSVPPAVPASPAVAAAIPAAPHVTSNAPPPPTATDQAPAPATAMAAAAATPAMSAEERFGLNGTQLAQKSGPPPAELGSLNAHVVRVTAQPAGGVVLDLDNGQRWRQTSLDQDLMLKPGDPVHIRRGTLGSFMLGAPNGRYARVSRLH
jgi:hypothetical protein